MTIQKSDPIVGLKRLMQIESLISKGIHMDAESHRRGSLLQTRKDSGVSGKWRQLRRQRTD